MKFKKLLSDCAVRRTDSSMPIVALLAGLAVGAVVGILLAPDSGENTRGRISDKAGDLAETVKHKIQTAKSKLRSEADEASNLKDEVTDKVKGKVKDVADRVKDAAEDAKSSVKRAADDANDAIQNS